MANKIYKTGDGSVFSNFREAINHVDKRNLQSLDAGDWSISLQDGKWIRSPNGDDVTKRIDAWLRGAIK